MAGVSRVSETEPYTSLLKPTRIVTAELGTPAVSTLYWIIQKWILIIISKIKLAKIQFWERYWKLLTNPSENIMVRETMPSTAG